MRPSRARPTPSQPPAATAALVLSALTLAGCLSEGTRAGRTDTTADTTSDVAGDTSPDVTPDVVPDTDGSDPCLGKVCDDQDECTYDYCDPSTGRCEYLALPTVPGAPERERPGDPAMPPEPPCGGDCDDQDVCTEDLCLWVPDGCGVQGYYACVNAPIEQCGSCPAGCDDGDPCTVDACAGQRCEHTPIEGCLSGCRAEGTLDIGSVLYGGFATEAKVAGTLVFAPLYQACNDGPTCDCDGWPGLRDSSGELLLDRPRDFTADSWNCASTGCGTVRTACKPAQLGVRYRAWGRPIPDWEIGRSQTPADPNEPPGAVPPARMVALAVTDFCLETVASSLVGEYLGTWDIAGQTATFKATIALALAPTLELSGITCVDATYCPQLDYVVRVPLTVGDGFVDIDAREHRFAFGGVDRVRLYSQRNTLTGRYGFDVVTPMDAELPSQDFIMPMGGTIALTRLSPGGATSAPPP